MTDLSTNPLQSNILIEALLEALFNAELSHTHIGSLPKTAEGKQLEEFKFCSMWKTYNKLVKDIHENVGKQVWPIVNPNTGCRLCIREIDTQEVDGKYFTSFVFAVDPLGYDANATPDPVLKEQVGKLFDSIEEKTFSPDAVFEALVENLGLSTLRVPEGSTPTDAAGAPLDVVELSLPWFGLTELIRQININLESLTDGAREGKVYILSLKTSYGSKTERSMTTVIVACDV